MIAAAVALGEGLGNDFLSGVITAIRVFESSLSGLDTVLDLPSVRDGSVGIAGYILTVALLALLLQTVMIVIRCLVVKGNGVFFYLGKLYWPSLSLDFCTNNKMRCVLVDMAVAIVSVCITVYYRYMCRRIV